MEVNLSAVEGSSQRPETSAVLKRAIDGDVEAYGTLYSMYIDRIYRYVFFRLKDSMMSEDVTEEVFVKAWKGIKSCKGKEDTFCAWLYRIAHNHTIDTLRRNRKEVSFEGLEFVDDADNEEIGRITGKRQGGDQGAANASSGQPQAETGWQGKRQCLMKS